MLFLLGVLFALPRPAQAEIWLKPELGTQFGNTDFELELEQITPEGDVKVRSLLEWPVDVVLIGVDSGAVIPARRGTDAWLTELRLSTNIGHARGEMIDSDWISSRSAELPPTLFAKTRSATDTFALLGDLTGGYRFDAPGANEWLAVDLLSGLRAEYYAMTALGAKGKYLDEDGGFRRIEISEDVDAAVYKVVHVLPFVGSRLLIQPLSDLSVALMARVHALLSYSHDDHVLRNKDAYGRAYGAAVSGYSAVDYSVTPMVSLGLSVEGYYLTSFTGVLEQEFYDDDPGTPGDERNSQVPDSDFAVESLRLQLMTFARVTF